MSPTILEGELRATGLRFAVVASRFNSFVVDHLVEGAVDILVRHGAVVSDITVVKVPGSLEIPFAARKLARTGQFDAIICLGAVIRGATSHYDHVASGAVSGVAQLAIETDVPVAMGILTTETVEQAIERAGTKAGNKGADAAATAIEMANLSRKLSPRPAALPSPQPPRGPRNGRRTGR
jgi:6,7-dimethyl-8-ribityllumazine synthase